MLRVAQGLPEMSRWVLMSLMRPAAKSAAGQRWATYCLPVLTVLASAGRNWQRGAAGTTLRIMLLLARQPRRRLGPGPGSPSLAAGPARPQRSLRRDLPGPWLRACSNLEVNEHPPFGVPKHVSGTCIKTVCKKGIFKLQTQ
jgi:hypothetical protein